MKVALLFALSVAAFAATTAADPAATLDAGRPSDQLDQEDRLGLTTMVYYTHRDWSQAMKDKGGEFRFDSVRFWGQTTIDEHYFASAQYRIYEDWQTPHHIWGGRRWENSELKLGQTWVPFGIRWSNYDDWGNVLYYTGFEDDSDYGITWEYHPEDGMGVALGFFKNQQLSSDSRQRYDTDIFSGTPSGDDANAGGIRRANEETNQFNLRVVQEIPLGNGSLELGASGMLGQLYNLETRDMGNRAAYGLHANLASGRWHAFLQGMYYDFTQKLPDTAPAGADAFVNVSSWNFAYEMPRQASLLATGVAYDINGEKLTIHTNYSRMTGGTTEADSWIWTAGVRSFWANLDVFLEGYWGHNDPQLSGRTPGYGRDTDLTDFRLDLRFVYRLSLLKSTQVERPRW